MNNNNSKRRLTSKFIFKTISLILIPLFIDVSTLVITLQQNQLGIANRAKDLDIAQKQTNQKVRCYLCMNIFSTVHQFL